jgi:hypothetical protein
VTRWHGYPASIFIFLEYQYDITGRNGRIFTAQSSSNNNNNKNEKMKNQNISHHQVKCTNVRIDCFLWQAMRPRKEWYQGTKHGIECPYRCTCKPKSEAENEYDWVDHGAEYGWDYARAASQVGSAGKTPQSHVQVLGNC